jgi:hypothetical protein
MSKFNIGDVLVRAKWHNTDPNLVGTVSQADIYGVGELIITESNTKDYPVGYVYLYSPDAWNLKEEQEEEKLPEMPDEVTYRGSGRELTVAPYHTSLGDIFIGIRTDGGYGVQTMHMDAEDVLSLCHDLRRYAMDAIRNRDK